MSNQERDMIYANKKILVEMESKLRIYELELERVSLPNHFNYPDAEIYQDFVIRKAQITVDEQKYSIKKFKQNTKLD